LAASFFAICAAHLGNPAQDSHSDKKAFGQIRATGEWNQKYEL
jgi:hypothetical protein